MAIGIHDLAGLKALFHFHLTRIWLPAASRLLSQLQEYNLTSLPAAWRGGDGGGCRCPPRGAPPPSSTANTSPHTRCHVTSPLNMSTYTPTDGHGVQSRSGNSSGWKVRAYSLQQPNGRSRRGSPFGTKRAAVRARIGRLDWRGRTPIGAADEAKSHRLSEAAR